MKNLILNFFKKKELLIIIFGIILSIGIAKINLNKFDKINEYTFGVKYHPMIKSGNHGVWVTADKFRKKLSSGNGFFQSIPAYERFLLPAIFVGSYYYILDKEIFEKKKYKDKKIIKVKNYKFGILLIQILVYYSSIYFLTKKIKTIFNNNYHLIVLLFLGFEPSILQWHSSFWSESLYLSMLIILLTLVINVSKNRLINFFIGVLMGLMFAQRSLSFLYIVPFIIYYVFVLKKNISPTLFFMSGFIFFMTLIGYNNFKKTDSAYLISSPHRYYSYYHYFAHIINADRLNISPLQAKKKYE